MKKILSDLQRVPIYTFFIGTAACVVLLVTSTAYWGENSSLDRSLIRCLFQTPYNRNATVLLFNVLDSPTSMTVWLMTLFPVIAVMPYASSYCGEFKTRSFYLSVSRMSHRSFCFAHFFACGVYSVCIMLCALLFTFILCIIGCENVFANVSVTALIRLLFSYCAYAFTLSSVCMCLCSLMLDPFIICCGVSLMIYIIVNISAVYLTQFADPFHKAQPNKFIYLLSIPNHAKGFPQFEELYGISYIFYVFGIIVLNIVCCSVVYACTKRRISQ